MCTCARVLEIGTTWVEGPEHSYSICSFNNADEADGRLIRRDSDKESQKTRCMQAGKEREGTEEKEQETEIQRSRTSLCVRIIF